MSKKLIIISGSALALSLVVGGPALADENFANQNGSSIRHQAPNIRKGIKALGQENNNYALGIISSINGSSFNIQNRMKNGTTTVTVNTTGTTIFKKDGQVAPLSDLAIGQRVIVVGIRDIPNKNIINATKVNISTKTPAKPGKKLGHLIPKKK